MLDLHTNIDYDTSVEVTFWNEGDDKTKTETTNSSWSWDCIQEDVTNWLEAVGLIQNLKDFDGDYDWVELKRQRKE